MARPKKDQPTDNSLDTPTPLRAAELTRALRAALEAAHKGEEWMLAWEVGDDTGGRGRSADLLALNLWRSRGQELHGFELKASRSDWLRELRRPAKAEAFAPYCEAWWLVTYPGVVKDGELPVGWGLYELRPYGQGQQLKRVVDAPRRVAAELPRGLMASFTRRAARPAEEELKRRALEQYQSGLSESERRWREREESIRARYEEELKAARAFEAMTGESLSLLIRDPGLAQTFALTHQLLGRGYDRDTPPWMTQAARQVRGLQSLGERVSALGRELDERLSAVSALRQNAAALTTQDGFPASSPADPDAAGPEAADPDASPATAPSN